MGRDERARRRSGRSEAPGGGPRPTTGSPATDPPSIGPRERILAAVDSIPRGRVATYGQVAEEAGLPRRARLVGRTLRELPAGTRLPWHRVVSADGRIADRGHPESEREQARRLAAEGVSVDARGRVALAAHRWRP